MKEIRNCSVSGCSREYRAKGYCATHWKRLNKYGYVPDNPVRSIGVNNYLCSAENCDRKLHANSLCINHYREVRRRAAGAEARKKREPNCSVELCEEVHYSLGYCVNHYSRLKSTGDLKENVPFKKFIRGQVGCLVTSCDRPHHSNGVCRSHNTTYRTYNISVDRLVELLSSSCEICSRTDRLSIDHDHSCCPGKTSCGKCVRGVLCTGCNRGIGQMMDNPEFLRKAAAYLESK